MDARSGREAAPTQERTPIERTSEHELVVTRTIEKSSCVHLDASAGLRGDVRVVPMGSMIATDGERLMSVGVAA